MNYPTSDIQFIAGIIRKVRAGDQVTVQEEARLNEIEAQGHSVAPIDGTPESISPPRVQAVRSMGPPQPSTIQTQTNIPDKNL